MRLRPGLRAGLLAALASLPGTLLPSRSARACQAKPVASVALVSVAGRVVVPVTVDGTPLLFLLDTGAERSLLGEDTVRRLGLPLDEWTGTTLRGAGGFVRHRNADARSVMLGGFPLRRWTALADTSFAVAPLPASAGAPIAGLLGQDFLARYDLDLDLPGHRLRLYTTQGCAGAVPPWTTPYDTIQAARPARNLLLIPATLDGKALRAELDTGASTTVLLASGLTKLGLAAENLTRDPAGTGEGIGGAFPLRRHGFATLRIGTQETRDPSLSVAPTEVNAVIDLLLGADWLQSRRVWISYTSNRLFVARPAAG